MERSLHQQGFSVNDFSSDANQTKITDMDAKEKKVALEILKRNITGYRGNIKQTDALRAMEEYASQVKDEWISVENPPEDYGDYLMCLGNKILGIGYWNGSEWDYEFETGTGTHWMPLPSPPNKNT